MFLLSGVEKEAIKKQLLSVVRNEKSEAKSESDFSENITKFSKVIDKFLFKFST